MAKDKRKKKYFQGIEHLEQEYVVSQEKSENIVSNKEEYRYLKKDLLTIILLILIFFGVLTGLTLLDKNTNYLTNLASKITSYFIKS